MIDKAKLKRMHRVARKCAGGDTLTEISDALKSAYAKEMGYTYENGKFYLSNGDGSIKNEVEVDQAALENYANFQTQQSAKLGSTMNGLASSIGALASAINPSDSTLTSAINASTSAAGQILEDAGIPAAGAFSKAVTTAGNVGRIASKIGGYQLDSLSTADKVMNSNLFNWNIGAIAGIASGKTDDFSIDDTTRSLAGASYTGAYNDITKAADVSGKRTLRAGKYNRQIADAREKQNQITNIMNQNRDANQMVQAMGDLYDKAYNYRMVGGYDQRAMRAAGGGSLDSSDDVFVPEITLEIERIKPGTLKDGGVIDQIINIDTGKIETWKPEISLDRTDETVMLKGGGNIERQLDAPEIEETDQKNIIPEGAYHKNKHNIDGLDGVTKKGIPVVDINSNKQQAEIERNEIIFTKEVTNVLESSYEKYYADGTTDEEKDNLAIELGKLLTKEIMLNTDDRTGLIDSLQTGGSIGVQKPSYEEWISDIDPHFMNDNYDLETAYNVLPFEMLQKWKNWVTGPNAMQDNLDAHLGSVAQLDDDTYMFLKKGRTTRDNPELKGEFSFYRKDPEFKKQFKMKFNRDENRWYYLRREHPKL